MVKREGEAGMAQGGLRGVFPVLPTPFAADAAPDEAAFLRLADFAIEAGADGVVFPGMASEVETLSADEPRAPARGGQPARSLRW
jgi:dihydrodipicolinate synthase/N-acetylneuraminate lyase